MLPFVSLFQSWIWIFFVLQDLKRVLSFPPYTGDYLHPVVYACTAVMLLCLLVSIMTYIIHHRWAKQIVRTFVENLIQYSHFSADTKKKACEGLNQSATDGLRVRTFLHCVFFLLLQICTEGYRGKRWMRFWITVEWQRVSTIKFQNRLD